MPFATTARAHPAGIIDLSVGTPVDPTPAVAIDALTAAANWPGYPQTYGTPQLREAVARWYARRRAVPDVDPVGVLPSIGSKELVAWLPTLLGLGPGDLVVHPEIAYPTYDIGARLAGARPVPLDDPVDGNLPAGHVGLLWLNTPANPHGRVMGTAELTRLVGWARDHDVVVASDECYAELGWDVPEVPSVLDPRVCGGSHEGLLSVYSLSKQSNLAGYRAAFVAGDPTVVQDMLQMRKHAGMMMPGPVQEVLRVVLDDDEHVEVQRERYRYRRGVLRSALTRAGMRIENSEAGLYLWATRDESCWETVADLASRGILVAPGEFYGPAARRHVRVALTAYDEQIEQVVERV